jgi:AsmA protein
LRTEHDEVDALAGVRRRRIRRRLLWSVAVLLVLLGLALVPPLMNANRLSRRIAASMSESLGRPVHLDNVTLHLLPMPGFTLENLVVSEDPEFGNEPAIRANTVEATLRPSSLWRRQVEFSTIRFVEPSLNLVRNKDGRWNLQGLLMHAAKVQAAPTEQRTAGPAPRFPYIEATGARVNLKLGEEKQPFSLTDADFALWSPSPDHWQVRVEAKATRTDENIADPGTMRLEGSLERAATMAEVPIDLQASWRDAPLGEASRLLTGDDAGWRGSLTVETEVVGTLGEAKVKTTVHAEDLRRADFVPAKTLTLNVDCTGKLDVTVAMVHDPACTLRSPKIDAIADSVDLSELSNGPAKALAATGVRVGSAGVPEAWLLDWARLFSSRIPAKEAGAGDVSGSLVYVPGVAGAAGTWQGQVRGDGGYGLPGMKAAASDGDAAALKRPEFVLDGQGDGAVLEPVDLMPVGGTAKSAVAPLMLSGTVMGTGYSLRLAGMATKKQVQALAGTMPPLTDGLEGALPAAVDDKPMKVDVTCARTWGGAQTCAATAVPVAVKKVGRRR